MANSIKARIANSVEIAFSRAMADAARIEEGVFEYDKDGNKCRVFTKENPCGKERIRAAVIGNRGVDPVELWELIGKEKVAYLVKLGYLVKDRGFYHVTKEMADSYKLPKVDGMPYFSYERLTGKPHPFAKKAKAA